MNRLSFPIEFFCYDSEIWCRTCDGKVFKISESDIDLVIDISEYIATFYPKAYSALSAEYISCQANIIYYRYRIVARFIRCNFAQLDQIPDIDRDLRCHFETVNCPLRGECRLDHVVCNPDFDHKLSAAELRVMRLVYDGLTEDQIASKLCLSPYTVHNHIRNAYARLGIHSKIEFVKFASKTGIFS